MIMTVKRIFCISTFLIFLILSPSSFSCTQYVSKSGSINGKSAATTIQAGISSLVPGDTLCVAAGTYYETVSVAKSGTASQPITIRAYDPANKPVIDGEYKLPAGSPANMNKSFYSNTKCYEVGEDSNANLGPSPKQACFVWAYMVSIKANHIVWDGIDITRSRGHGVLIGKYNGPSTTFQSVQFRNSEISRIRNEGVYIGGVNDVSFRNNIVRDTNDFAAYSRSAPIIVWSGSTATFTGGGPGWSGGIYLLYSEKIDLIDNNIFHNWGEGLGTGLFNNVTQNTQIKGNDIYDNMSSQLYLSNSSQVVAEKNLIYHTGDPKYYLNSPGWSACISIASEDGELMDDLLIANNILAGCAGLVTFGQYVPASKVTDVRIYNNTFLGGGKAMHSGSISLNNSGLTFVNNLVFSKPGSIPSIPSMDFHHNLWSSTAPSNLQGVGDIVTSIPGLSNPSYKPQAGTFDTSSIKLLSTSAAVNKGISITEVSEDFFSTARPSGVAFDMGAHEFSTGGGQITDTVAPSIRITSPTSSAAYSTTTSTIALSGTSADNIGVSAVSWTSDKGGGGVAAGTASWSISGIALLSGANLIRVTAKDAANNASTDTITVTYNATASPGPIITSALSSTGTAGTAFSYQITAANGPTSFNAAGLPAGLSVSTGTGRISGTPTTVGTSSVAISAANAVGTGVSTLTLSVYSACDLNRDASTNVVDVQLQVNQALGAAACTSDLNRDGSCNVIDVQRDVNAGLRGQCVLGP